MMRLFESFSYIGRCDILRGDCRGENENLWNRMITQSTEITWEEFIADVDYHMILDVDETIEEYIEINSYDDPEFSAHKSMWGNEPCYFVKSKGFEYIFV